jgi:uncharacterized protein (DUF1501 family)
MSTIDRRQWLKQSARLGTVGFTTAGMGSLAMVPASGWWQPMLAATDQLKASGKSCILVWLQGGPSQFETWDPKPGTDTGGPTKAIATNVPGIEISEHLPHLAKQADKLCIVRSMTSREGAHPRATQLLHTGYLPTSSVRYPTLGAHVAQVFSNPASELPGFVRIAAGNATDGGGFLGVRYNPLAVGNPGKPPANTKLTVDEARFRRRLRLLEEMETSYEKNGGQREVTNQRDLTASAAKMLMSKQMEAFDLSKEPANQQQRYGEDEFGRGCLLARRLIETGVPFVEIQLGNWDTHQGNFEKVPQLCGRLDQPLAALLEDLQQRGRLDDTLVICMGEFGRTPRINPNAGRDHFPKAFSIAMAGGGIRGGQVIGATDKTGNEVYQQPVKVADLFNTFFTTLGIDANEELDSGARPITRADKGNVIPGAIA